MDAYTQYLIICPLLFLGGFVDSIAGGGGLITLPAYLLAGLPPHLALGTNKFSSAIGAAGPDLYRRRLYRFIHRVKADAAHQR